MIILFWGEFSHHIYKLKLETHTYFNIFYVFIFRSVFARGEKNSYL